MNLFDWIDGLFEGVVFFAYNAVRTVTVVILSPCKGPLRLMLHNRNPRIRQMRSQTALLIASLGFAWLLMSFSAISSLSMSTLMKQFARTPSLTSDNMWPYLASAFAGVITIDAALRLMLWLRFPSNPQRRAIGIATYEYALILPVVGLLAAPQLIDWMPASFGLLSILLIPPYALVLMVAPTVQIFRILRPHPASIWRRWLHRRVEIGLRLVAAIFFSMTLFILYSVVISQVANGIDSARAPETGAARMSIQKVECRIDARGVVQAHFVIANESPAQLMLGSRDFYIQFGVTTPDPNMPDVPFDLHNRYMRNDRLVWNEGAEAATPLDLDEILLVAPNASVVVHGHGVDRIAAGRADNVCAIGQSLNAPVAELARGFDRQKITEVESGPMTRE